MPKLRVCALISVGLLGLAGCGSSSTGTGGNSPSSGGNQSPTTQQSSGSSTPKIAATACSLLTAAQLTDLMGEAPADAGSELDHADNYKTCNWNTANSSNHVGLGVVRNASSSDKGFAYGGDFGPPETVTGIGDSATFATRGQTDVELIVNKALWSISLDSSAAASSSALKAKMVDVARQILTQLGLS
jgi:hypothetical protein